ncbi:MAG: MFS transporter [Paracoccaceae bacterium]|nr:MFS transporter [Paracoccaceae bacterium]
MSFLNFVKQNANWLGAGALLAFLSSFGQTYFLSIFAGEIRSSFGLSHGAWGGIYTLGTSASAVVMVWAGGLADRFRVRYLGAATLFFLAISCLFMSIASAIWMLPFVIFTLRLCGQGMATHITAVAMSRWFVASRGKALSFAHLGYSVGEALLPLIIVTLISIISWQSIWACAAVVNLICIPALWIMLRTERTPQSIAKSNQSIGMVHRHWTRPEALKHWLFWAMVPSLLGPTAFSTAFFFNQVHFAEIKGWSHIQLVALFPVYTITAVLAMLGSGWALDRFGTGRLIPWFLLPIMIAFLAFSTAQNMGPMLLGFFLMALTSGMGVTLPNAFWAEFYGTQNLGSIKAMVSAVMVLGSAIGPGLTGFLIDYGVGLEVQYIGVAGYFLCATLIMFAGVKKAMPLLDVN